MRKFLRNEEGSVIILVALLLPILIGFIGITIDGGNMIYQKSRLIEATEAAGRSAILMSYDKDIWESEKRVVLDLELAQQSVEEILKLNYDNAVIEEVDIVNENGLLIHTSVSVDYTFMKLFGYSNKIIESTQTSWGG